jgi:hypothetical protein
MEREKAGVVSEKGMSSQRIPVQLYGENDKIKNFYPPVPGPGSAMHAASSRYFSPVPW